MGIVFGHRMRKHLDFDGMELVPFGTPIPLHSVNPRNMLETSEWNKIRKDCYQKYDYHCAICGQNGLEQGYNHPVKAHEKWDYDFDKEVQYFEGVVPLCPICHKVIHWEQNRFLYNNGDITLNEFEKEQDKKHKKLKEVNGNRFGFDPIRLKNYRWHDGDWVSDFSKLKQLYPFVNMKMYFNTQYNGIFKREVDSYIYKKGELEDLF